MRCVERAGGERWTKERSKPLRAPLIVVVGARVREHKKVPAVEQIVAAGAAAQNILVAAHALGFGGFWRTGNAAYDDGIKTALGLHAGDAIVGFLYLGTPAVPAPPPGPSNHAAQVVYWTGPPDHDADLECADDPTLSSASCRRAPDRTTPKPTHEDSYHRGLPRGVVPDRRIGRRAGPCSSSGAGARHRFDGGWNLPVWAAQRQGFFEANGVAVQLAYTPNSGVLDRRPVRRRATTSRCADGQLDRLPGRPGRGEDRRRSPTWSRSWAATAASCRSSPRPSIKSFADLKGKTLSVDAMTTGAAFVLRELLARSGVGEADVTLRARRRARRTAIASCSPASTTRRCCARRSSCWRSNRGYQRARHRGDARRLPGHRGSARRSWAQRRTRRRWSASCARYRAGRRLGSTIRPTATIVEAMLVANIRDMTPGAREAVVRSAARATGGLTRDAALDIEGIRTVLALRSKYATPPKTLERPDAATSTSRTTTRRSAAALNSVQRRRHRHGQSKTQATRRSSGPTTSIRITLGPAAAGARPHAGRLRGARRFPPAARVPARRARAPRSRNSGLGALLVLRPAQHPLHTSTVIGEWARDKLTRYSLLTGNGDPYIWDFGSAAKHHRLHAPWLHHDHCRAGLLGLRGAVGGDIDAVPRRGARDQGRSSTPKASATCRSASTSSSRRCCSSCRSWASRCATASR